MGNLFKKNLEIEGIIQKYLLPLLLLISLVLAGPRAEKIGNLLADLDSISYISTYRAYVDPETRNHVYVFPSIFDHNDNLWFFWKEYMGEWHEEDRNEKPPPPGRGIFCKKLSIDGNEILSKQLLYKGDFQLPVPYSIFLGSENNLYFIKRDILVRIDSLGNMVAESEKLGCHLLQPYIWFDTINNIIYFHHSNGVGRSDFHILNAKTLEILDTLTLSEGFHGKISEKPLPPNLKWFYRFYIDNDVVSVYEIHQGKYFTTDWFGQDVAIICGVKNLGEAFIHKINLKKLVLLDSFSFDIKKYSYKHYEGITCPKIQIVKDKKEGFWIFIPLQYGRNKWVSVVKLDNKGKLIIPSKTIEDIPMDFDAIPNHLPKQVLIKKIIDRVYLKTIEFDANFFGFDMDGNLYYYKYQKKRQ